jgi:hypothetical protein
MWTFLATKVPFFGGLIFAYSVADRGGDLHGAARARWLMIVFAATGFFWLVILLWLAGSNFLMRPQFPPPADLF